MAILHIYESTGNVWVKIAEGEGVIDPSGPFEVILTEGRASVSSGQAYQLCEGPAAAGLLCDCGAVAGGTATFQANAGPAHAVRQSWSGQRRPATLNVALTAVCKSIVIQIGTQDLVMLKSNAYALCVAKKVGTGGDAGSYTIVWRTFTDYLENISLSWTPQYAMFGSDVGGNYFGATTNMQEIGLGEQCVLDAFGVVGEPAAGGPATGVTMVNNHYLPTHPGLGQMAMLAGIPQLTPVHIAPEPLGSGTMTLTPMEMALVWFQQDVQTSMLLSGARSIPSARAASSTVEIDLTSANRATRLYRNGQWSTP